MGGCLFIDEAYALAEGDGPIGSGGDSFAKEAVRGCQKQTMIVRKRSIKLAVYRCGQC